MTEPVTETSYEAMLREAEAEASYLAEVGRTQDGDETASPPLPALSILDEPLLDMVADIPFATVAALLRRQSEALETMRACLTQIRAGSKDQGRWLARDGSEEVGGDPDGPDEGFYDRDEPPEGYDSDGWVGGRGMRKPAEPLEPADWEEYTKQEQSDWLSSVYEQTGDALAQVGALKAEAG